METYKTKNALALTILGFVLIWVPIILSNKWTNQMFRKRSGILSLFIHGDFWGVGLTAKIGLDLICLWITGYPLAKS